MFSFKSFSVSLRGHFKNLGSCISFRTTYKFHEKVMDYQKEYLIIGNLVQLRTKDDALAASSEAELGQNHQHSALHFGTSTSKSNVRLSKDKHVESDTCAQSPPVPLYCIPNRGLNHISHHTGSHLNPNPARFPETADILSEGSIKEEEPNGGDPFSRDATVVMPSTLDCDHISGNSNEDQRNTVERIGRFSDSDDNVSSEKASNDCSDIIKWNFHSDSETENPDEELLNIEESDENLKDTPKVVQEVREEESCDMRMDDDSQKHLIGQTKTGKRNIRKLSGGKRPGNEKMFPDDDAREQSDLEIESRRKNLYANKFHNPLDTDEFHVKRNSSSACWICLQKFVRCSTVKKHIIQRHSKALGAIYQEETKDARTKRNKPQLLLFCPNDCNFITSKPDALLYHMGSCQKAKLQMSSKDLVKIQTDFISNDFKKLQHQVLSGTIGRGKEGSAAPTAGMKKVEQSPLPLNCTDQNDRDKDIDKSQDQDKPGDVVPASVKRPISPHNKGERDDKLSVDFDEDQKEVDSFLEITRRDRAVHLSDEEYNRLLKLMALPVSERSKTRQDNLLHRKVKKHHLKLVVLPDPYRGEEVSRITKMGRIILPPQEVGKCIDFFHKQAFGDTRDKLVHIIRQKYVGISRERIVQHLNNKSEIQSHLKPHVKNKAYCPVAASCIMERHQIDVIDFGTVASHLGKYCYALSVLDCFSHFLWTRVIPDKKARTISEKLKQIYSEYGTPCILQSSQGREFHKELEHICHQWNIKLIHSQSDQAQPQNRIERFHGAWQTRIRSLVCGLLAHPSVDGKDLAEAIAEVTRTYNITHHSGIGMSPYECVFGVKPNFISQAYAGGLCEDLREEEQEMADCSSSCFENEGCEDSGMDCDDVSDLLKKRKQEILEMRAEATKISVKRQRKIEDYHHQKFYKTGEVVTIKGEGHDVDGKGDMSCLKPRLYYQALVRGRRDNMYTVMIISKERRGEIETVHVDRIISRACKKRIRKKDDGSLYQEQRETIGTILKRLENLENETCQRDMCNTSKTHIEVLLENAACHGLELERDNYGDGNNLFRALLVQLEKHGIIRTEMELRKDVVAFLSENVLLGEGRDWVYLPDFLIGYPSWEAFLEDLGQGAVKGDHLVLLAAVNIYNMRVWIVSNITKSEPVILRPICSISAFDVHFGRISESHYVNLQPQPELCEHCGVVAVRHKCKNIML